MLNDKDHVHFWRELERIEQRLSTGASVSLGRLYDSMGGPGLQSFTHYGNDLAAGLARVDRVRQALDQSGPMARQLMMKQLSGIELSGVWDVLVDACKEIALYYGGAVVTGAVAGGAIGAIVFGVGAAPGAVIGTAAGAEIGMWVLALLGLKALAEGLASMLPAALDHYERGFREAWGATPRDRQDTWHGTTAASGNAYTGAWHMAQGHVIMVFAILTALVAYLTRGKGNRALLMQEIRQSSRLGPKFADWVVENERKLLGHQHLQVRPSTPTAMSAGESLPASAHGVHTPTKQQKVGAIVANNASRTFKPGEDVIHFAKHGTEIAQTLGYKNYSLSQYVQDANSVISNGKFVPELNAYVSIPGGTGAAKGLMVGLDRATGEITTMHMKPVAWFEAKAPSLGWVAQPKAVRMDTVGPNPQNGWKWPY